MSFVFPVPRWHAQDSNLQARYGYPISNRADSPMSDSPLFGWRGAQLFRTILLVSVSVPWLLRMPPVRKFALLSLTMLSVRVRALPLKIAIPAAVLVFPCRIVTPEMATTLPPVIVITRLTATPGFLETGPG